MKLIAERAGDILVDFHLTMLSIAYPRFRFTAESRPAGRHRWVAGRRNLAAGLHTVVTGDLDELLAALGPADPSREPIYRDLGAMCRDTPAHGAGGGT